MRPNFLKYSVFSLVLALFAVFFLLSPSLSAEDTIARTPPAVEAPEAPEAAPSGEAEAPPASPGLNEDGSSSEPEAPKRIASEEKPLAAPESNGSATAAPEAVPVATDAVPAAVAANPDAAETEAADFYRKGLYAKAEKSYKELVELALKNSGPENPKTVGLRVKYALALHKAGRFKEAIKYMDELLPLAAKVMGEISEEYMELENYRILSLLFYHTLDKSEPDPALSEEEKVVNKRKSVLGDEHPQTLIALRQYLQIKNMENETEAEDVASLKRILSAQEKALGENDKETLETAHLLASSLLDFYTLKDRSLAKAEEKEIKDLIAKTLAGRRELLGDVHPDVSETMSLYVLTDVEVKDFQKAYEEIQKVSDIEVQTLGPDHPWSVNSYIITGALLRDVGKPEEVLQAYEKALDSSLRFYGEENFRTNTIRTYIASYYLSFTDDRDKALEILSQVLSWQEKNLGPEHKDTMETLSYMASVYDETGDFQKARPIYERILKSRMASLGESHEDTMIISNRLDYQKILEGEVDKAREVYEDIYKKTSEALGPDHLETLRIQVPLALVYSKDGDNLRAKELLKKASEAFKKLKGPDDYETLDALTYLSNVCFELGENEEARDLAEKILEARIRTQGDEHRDALNARRNLAFIYVSLKEDQKAKPLLEDVVAREIELYGPQDPRTLRSRQSLATVCKDLGLRSEAKSMYLSLLSDLENIHGARDPITTNIRNQLALVF
jgi:Tfp pilus assembly protein PilF